MIDWLSTSEKWLPTTDLFIYLFLINKILSHCQSKHSIYTNICLQLPRENDHYNRREFKFLSIVKLGLCFYFNLYDVCQDFLSITRYSFTTLKNVQTLSCV